MATRTYSSFALRGGTTARVTTQAIDGYALPCARSSVEDDELALNEAGWDP